MHQNMNDIVSLCKRRGFIFPSGDIYGGLKGFWDYGPLGAQLKKNIRDIWWKDVVECSPLHPKLRKPLKILPFDGSIISNPFIWEASGHVDKFKDLFLTCSRCDEEFKDSDWEKNNGNCPSCLEGVVKEGSRSFDLMFKTESGVIEGDKTTTYLRPETAQSIFVNFANIVNTSRVKLPFGVSQVGKAFRNEVTPRNFTFRSREFEQMEIEFFVREEEAEDWYRFWIKNRYEWWKSIGIEEDNLDLDVHKKSDLAHYAKSGYGVTDIQFKFPFGFAELEGIAHRTNFDIKNHEKQSKVKLIYSDMESGEKIYPHVIEPSAGLDRAVLAVICSSYIVDESRPSKLFLNFEPRLAPIKVAFFPLRNKDGMPEFTEHLFNHYRRKYNCVFEPKGHIGKRYARMDEVGTPFCVTIDDDTLNNETVTVRHRDTTEQDIVSLGNLEAFLEANIGK